MTNTVAVVLAAGKGTRMKSDVPKVLHHVGGRPMISYVISSLKDSGIKDITVVVGHKGHLVKENIQLHGIRFAVQKHQKGSQNALYAGINGVKKIPDNILVTCGDSPLIEKNMFKAIVKVHNEKDASCTILTAMFRNPFSYGRIIKNGNDNVLKIVEEKDASPEEKKIKEINTATYCFNGRDLKDYIKKVKINKRKKEFYLTDIIELLAKDNKKISTCTCTEEEALGINSRADIAVANSIINKRTLAKIMESGVTIIDPGSTFVDTESKIGKDTIIYPNTIIEKDVKIAARCKIGPFARIRPGSVLESNVEIGNFVEIVRTKIGKNSKVKHHSYLGDSVIGKNVNIGAGTITANYDGKAKHRTVVKDEVFIGVGVSLIAPVQIGKGAKVGAGSVVTKKRNVAPGEVVAGVPARKIHPN